MDFWSILEQTLVCFEVCKVWLDNVYAIRCVSLRVRVGMRGHAIMLSKRGIMILVSGLPLTHNLCVCTILNRQCKLTVEKKIMLCFYFYL